MKMLRPLTAKPPKQGPARSRGGDERHQLYSGRRWRKLRAEVLQREPLCRECLRTGLVAQAVVVDHIAGHGPGWQARFYDRRNLQPLCQDCHKAKTIQEQHGGAVAAKTMKTPVSHPPTTTRHHTDRKGSHP